MSKELEAELAAAKKRIADLEGGRGGAVDPQIAKKVAAIKSAAKKVKEHGGTVALYKVGAAGHYREGRMYAEGEVVRIPVDQDPSHTFEPVLDEAKAPAGGGQPPSGDDAGKPKRASDRDI